MPILKPQGAQPPLATTPFASGEWQDWFYKVFKATLENGGVFGQLTFQGVEREVKLTTEDLWQELITINSGIYSNYTTTVGNIAYGFAANVRRSGGNAYAVGAQINAWCNKYVPAGQFCFGIATTAVGEDGFPGAVIGFETTPLCQYDDNQYAKFGISAVFKNRFDGVPAVVRLGANRYNYFAIGLQFSSQVRSTVGERCGWNRGIQFITDSVDSQIALTWNNTTAYGPGDVVTSGGRSYQAIQVNLNQLPAPVSIYWVPLTVAGTAALAIGIDFCSVGVGTMARMASAIRLRDTMRIDFDVTGAIGSFFDPVAGRQVIVDNNGVRQLECDVITGFLYRNGVFLI